MGLEAAVSRLILKKGFEILNECCENDVVIVGAGPAGLTCALKLAESDVDVVVIERKLYVGGGMPGGGMFIPAGTVLEDSDAVPLLEELGVELEEGEEGLLLLNPVEATLKIATAAVDNGARILVGIEVEDVVERRGEVKGVVVNWTAARQAGIHVDPLMMEAEFTVDATGHEASVCKLAGVEIKGEGKMWVERGEELVVKHSGEVKPGLYAVGMAAAAVKGSPRMGPTFGGMLESGMKVAEEIAEKL